MQGCRAGFIKGYQGVQLYYKFWHIPNSQARIIFLHGLGEYSGKYVHFAEWFVNNKIEVFFYDLRGHGRSDGPRCHVEDFNNYALDLDIFIRFIDENQGYKKTFLVSHSIGGLITLFYCINFPYRLQGIVACSPCLGLKLKIESVKTWAVYICYPILKNKSFSNNIKYPMVTHDSDMIEKFKKDPLIRHTITANLYIQMIKTIKYVRSQASAIRVPLLILQAGNDKICDAKMAEYFYKNAASQDKEFKLYKSFYHEILNEVEREDVFKDIYDWIKIRC